MTPEPDLAARLAEMESNVKPILIGLIVRMAKVLHAGVIEARVNDADEYVNFEARLSINEESEPIIALFADARRELSDLRAERSQLTETIAHDVRVIGRLRAELEQARAEIAAMRKANDET